MVKGDCGELRTLEVVCDQRGKVQSLPPERWDLDHDHRPFGGRIADRFSLLWASRLVPPQEGLIQLFSS